jgi:hypothetical protein
MSHDGHLLLLCDVTAPAPAAGHTENTACCTVAWAYRVYRAVAWQRVAQIRHSIVVFKAKQTVNLLRVILLNI